MYDYTKKNGGELGDKIEKMPEKNLNSVLISKI
jgi:hypothetical protein